MKRFVGLALLGVLMASALASAATLRGQQQKRDPKALEAEANKILEELKLPAHDLAAAAVRIRTCSGRRPRIA